MNSSRQGLCLDCIFVLNRHRFGKEEGVNTSKGKGVNSLKSLLVPFPKWLLSLRDTQTSVCLCHLRKCNFRYHWEFYLSKFKSISFLRYFLQVELNKNHSFSYTWHRWQHVSDFLWKCRTVGSMCDQSLFSQKPNNLLQQVPSLKSANVTVCPQSQTMKSYHGLASVTVFLCPTGRQRDSEDCHRQQRSRGRYDSSRRCHQPHPCSWMVHGCAQVGKHSCLPDLGTYWLHQDFKGNQKLT